MADVSAEPTDDESLGETAPKRVPVPSGGALTVEASLRVTLRSAAKVVVPVGPVGCGKSTLITTIYDQFQLGPFGGWLFAGSETLLAFEQRSFLSRTASGRATAGIERTSLSSGEQLVHLRLQDEGQVRAARDLLLADISGELFQSIADHPEQAKS